MRLYRTPVGVISGLILFRLVTFWGRSAMGWSVPFSLGEFLVKGPLLSRLEPLADAIAVNRLVAGPIVDGYECRLESNSVEDHL
jgi:hypothetical protein